MPEQSNPTATATVPTVMIVEDEFLIAMDLEAILERHGYRVLGPAATVKQALDLLGGQRPDVALLDVSLNGEWATDVADGFRRAEVPYVLMSAYGDEQLRASGLLNGTQNIGKPVSERRLIGALADAMKQPKKPPMA